MLQELSQPNPRWACRDTAVLPSDGRHLDTLKKAGRSLRGDVQSWRGLPPTSLIISSLFCILAGDVAHCPQDRSHHTSSLVQERLVLSVPPPSRTFFCAPPASPQAGCKDHFYSTVSSFLPLAPSEDLWRWHVSFAEEILTLLV